MRPFHQIPQRSDRNLRVRTFLGRCLPSLLMCAAWSQGFGSLDVTIALSIPAGERQGHHSIVTVYMRIRTFPPALQFRESLGGDEKINAYCHALAVAGGKRLAEMLGTRMLDDTPEHTWTANMVSALKTNRSLKFDCNSSVSGKRSPSSCLCPPSSTRHSRCFASSRQAL